MLLGSAARGIPVDHALGAPPLEADTIPRATDAEVEQSARHGWHLSRKLFSDDEIDALVAASDQFYDGHRDRTLPLRPPRLAYWEPSDGPVQRHHDYVHYESDAIARILRKPLVGAVAARLAQADQIPTLIFDEIDQGIGGRVGTIVGQKLWSLARKHQVLCITHLPQLAAFSDQHFQVQKLVFGERTTTQVKDLDGEARVLELAQMMGNVSEGTLHSARELIQTVQKRIV